MLFYLLFAEHKMYKRDEAEFRGLGKIYTWFEGPCVLIEDVKIKTKEH